MKLIGAFFISVVLSTGSMILVGLLMTDRTGRFLHDHPIIFGFFLVTGFAGFLVLFFLLLTRGKIRYLEQITRTLGVISEGDLSARIPVLTGDELGMTAQAVNEMAHKLSTAIEEERRLEKAKNDLIVNVSHDLRTPLTSVMGYLGLIEDMPKDDPRLKEYAGIAHTKCKGLSALIDGLFEYTRLTDAQMVPRRAPINIGELLEQVVLGFIPALNDAGMEYRLRFTDERCMVDADPTLTMRVFNNLVQNAITHGVEGKAVDIELGRKEGQVWVRVVSYGKTIPAEELPHVFEKFYQADRSSAAGSRGAGLGLAIAKRIVEMHGGSIGVGSTAKKTVFEVMLPLA